jgi:L-ascorbate metabolism protein UlaG (beta-lactamase superfamily)
MEAEFYGANCIRLRGKKVSIVIDDYEQEKGKIITKPGDISVFTKQHDKEVKSAFTVDWPGEYEVNDVSIHGISARSHTDTEEEKTSVIYRFIINDFRIAVTGHIYPDLSEQQLESIGMVDVLFIPVGGNGYTLDGIGALKVIKKIGPSIVVPTHYAAKGIKYEVPQADLSEVRKTISLEPVEELDQLKLKGREFAEGTKLIILKNSL